MYNVERIWRAMKARCYTGNNPAYIDCTVCKEWMLDYKAFEDWFVDNLYNCGDEHLELDKDLFSTDKKNYSPETCCLLPKRINTMLAYKKSSFSIFPTGITITTSGKYQAIVYSGHGYIRDTFPTVEQAVDFYCKMKERNIKRLAVGYEKYLPDRIYDALISYKCKI